MVYEVTLRVRRGRGSTQVTVLVSASNPWSAEAEAVRRVSCGGFAPPATRTLGIVARPVFGEKKT